MNDRICAKFRILAAGLLLAKGGTALAAVSYVDMNSASPTPPYTNWATATRVIQEAVDAAAEGDEIVVTNGTYGIGGRAVYGTMTNRVAVDRAVTLRSVNGPEFTIIQGLQVPGITNGDGAIRCVYLTNGASLSGFTLTRGATRSDSDHALFESSGGGVWCESGTVVVSTCVLAGNSAFYQGGGAYGGTLNNCVLTDNSASFGGGAVGNEYRHCTLNNCVLAGNAAFYQGGGAFASTLNNCTLTGNSAYTGGAVAGFRTLGDKVFSCVLNNCVAYFNTATHGANYGSDSSLSYCCTTPLPLDGTGNISVDPQLASASHLSAASPCRGAGRAAYATATDIDGEAWASPPSIGCDEFHSGALTGQLSVGITAAFTNVAAGYALELLALIQGRTGASVWDFGDGLLSTNQPYVAHAWAVPGDYVVVLRAYNESHPTGISATVTLHVVTPPIHYVAADSTSPVAPYASWATAAANIQDAVDAFGTGTVPGALVLVTNGTYATGGRAVDGTLTNRLAVDKRVTVQSVNGPQCTIIRGWQVPGSTNGDGAIRCVYLANGASLSGFTLTNGATRSAGDYNREQNGGAVWCESSAGVVSNCVVAANSAFAYGGGTYSGTLNNCTLSGNTAQDGGGAFDSTLNDCTLSGNSAQDGGGAYGGTLNDCTLTANSANYYGGGVVESTLNNCTLSGNTAQDGGGALESTLNSCTLRGNSAQDGAGLGLSSSGGASGGTLNNCTLTGNSASGSYSVGGVRGCTLNNCTLTGNSADYAGGASSCTLNNCIIYFNTGAQGANYDSYSTLNYCCTAPQPTNGVGNISNQPLFIDLAGRNLQLQTNSPCINAGNNAYVAGSTDLDDDSRIVGGTVDIGAYEFQTPVSLISYAWLQHYGLGQDGSADYADPDADGLNNWQEWRCGTNPTNALSVLRLLAPVATSTNVTVAWQSVGGVSYFLERSTDLAVPMVFTPLATNILGQDGTAAYTDTTAVGVGASFYRVGVSSP